METTGSTASARPTGKPPTGTPRTHSALRLAALSWFTAATIGQLAFVWMILAHYGRTTLSGQMAHWNDKPLIKGFVAGDSTGNLMFAVHVLLAAAVTLGGLAQLVPAIRRRAPYLHRWIGRSFFAIACVMALNGLWLTWVRHTYLSVISGLAVSMDGILILIFSALAWRHALARDLPAHRRWALRAFLVVNGVWFLRIGMMAWVLITGGGLGMNRTLSGPADIVLQYGAYLIPLAILEVYFAGQQSHSAKAVSLAAALVFCAAAITLVGTGGAIAFMWGPYMM